MSMRRIVAVIWWVSSLTLLVDQASQVRRDAQDAAAGIQLEIPREDHQRVQEVLAACQRLTSPEQRIGILFYEPVASEHFLSYRLAYARYPALVVSHSYGSFPNESTVPFISRQTFWRAFNALKQYDLDYLLVLGLGHRVFRGTRLVEQLSANDVLLEVL